MSVYKGNSITPLFTDVFESHNYSVSRK